MNKKTIFFLRAFFSLIVIVSTLTAGVAHDIKKTQISVEKIKAMCSMVYQQVVADNFKPDLLIGLSRGGLVPLGFLAGEQMFNNRMTKMINTCSYDDQGHQKKLSLLFPVHTEEFEHFRSILVIDDIADSGKTLDYVMTLLKKNLPTQTIKTATLFYKKRSVIKPDYYAEETEDWIVFPWEQIV